MDPQEQNGQVKTYPRVLARKSTPFSTLSETLPQASQGNVLPRCDCVLPPQQLCHGEGWGTMGKGGQPWRCR